MLIPFTLGLLGSMHCIGMCGPIALALPTQSNSKFNTYCSIFLYHFGRLSTYSLLGFVLGYFSFKVYFFGYQRYFSIIVGVILILSVLPFLKTKAISNPLLPPIKHTIGKLFQKRGIAVFWLIGFFNGLLPCGFVYLALAGAATSQYWWYGTLFMFYFGLGTLPAMLSISFLKHKINLKLRNTIKRLSPIFVLIMGFLLVIRGLNLGVPYLSPYASETSQTVPWCH